MVRERFGAFLRGERGRRSTMNWAERLCLALAFLAVIIVIYAGSVELRRQGIARESLAQLKAARLAASAISAQCYATGQPFADQTTADGFAPGVAQQVRELGRLPGEIKLLRIDENGYTVRELLYREDDFYALYEAGEGFTVYRGLERLHFAESNRAAG